MPIEPETAYNGVEKGNIEIDWLVVIPQDNSDYNKE